MTSENYHNLSLAETFDDEQLAVAVVSNASSQTGSVCPFSRGSAPGSSAWLRPSSGSGASQQLSPGSDYLYQHAGSTMLSGLPGQIHIATSAASCSGAFEWQPVRNAKRGSPSLGDMAVTIISQDASVSSMSRAAQCREISHAHAIVTWNPTLPASLVLGTTSHQGPYLSSPYQGGSQVYYCDPNTLGPLLCSSGPHVGREACADPQPKIIMVLKEIRPTNTPPAVPTSEVYYAVPVQYIPGSSCGVTKASQETDASLGIRTALRCPARCQTFCLPQTAKLIKSCTQILHSNTPPQSRDIFILSSSQSPSNFLALPPAPSQEQAVNKTLDEVKAELSTLLENHPISKDNRDAPVLSLKMPDICNSVFSVGPVSQGNTPGSENAKMGESSLRLKGPWLLEDGLGLNIGSADISTLVGHVCLPQVFKPLTDCNLCERTTATNTKDTGATEVDRVQKNTIVEKALPDLLRKTEEKVSEPVDGAPEAKFQRQDPESMMEGEVVEGSAAASNSAPDITAKHSHHRTQKAASSRPKKAKGSGHENTKRLRENKFKKREQQNQSRSKVKAEEKPAILKKRKGHPPELCQEAFKKPRSSLGMHILESVQVFHALGKKTEQKTGVSSSWALGNTRSTKELKPSPALKSGLHIPCQGTGTDITEGKGGKPEGSADTECPSPSQCELPPPGKVKLVPLPFLSLDKPQAHPVPRRPPSLASQRDPSPDPARPPANLAQLPAVHPSQPAPASTSLIDATKPEGPVSTRPYFNIPTQLRPPQSAASRPAPYKTSSRPSLHKEPVSTAPTKAHSPPKAHNLYLLEDFSRQPIPWRKVDFPGPVVSTPITDEQRPEREAMKRQAQRERENAAQYTALGKVQFFVQREKDMEISQHYGYVM